MTRPNPLCMTRLLLNPTTPGRARPPRSGSAWVPSVKTSARHAGGRTYRPPGDARGSTAAERDRDAAAAAEYGATVVRAGAIPSVVNDWWITAPPASTCAVNATVPSCHAWLMRASAARSSVAAATKVFARARGTPRSAVSPSARRDRARSQRRRRDMRHRRRSAACARAARPRSSHAARERALRGDLDVIDARQRVIVDRAGVARTDLDRALEHVRLEALADEVAAGAHVEPADRVVGPTSATIGPSAQPASTRMSRPSGTRSCARLRTDGARPVSTMASRPASSSRNVGCCVPATCGSTPAASRRVRTRTPRWW